MSGFRFGVRFPIGLPGIRASRSSVFVFRVRAIGDFFRGLLGGIAGVPLGVVGVELAVPFVGKDPLAMGDAMGDAMGETERRRGCRGRRGPITSKKNVDVVFRA